MTAEGNIGFLVDGVVEFNVERHLVIHWSLILDGDQESSVFSWEQVERCRVVEYDYGVFNGEGYVCSLRRGDAQSVAAKNSGKYS